MNDHESNTNSLVMTSLIICIILIGTILFRIPVPMTQGYVHLGDAMIYMGVFVLGKRKGALAAGLGSALADILGGYAVWAPWSLVIKALMAFAAGMFLHICLKHKSKFTLPILVAGMVVGGMIMTSGYLLAEYVMYGNMGTALLGVPWNIGQFVVGIIISLSLSSVLQLTSLQRFLKWRV